MKRIKFLVVAETIVLIMNIMGCGKFTTASSGTQSLQQDNIVLSNIIERKDDFMPAEEAAEQKPEIIFNERGFTYSRAGNTNGSIKEFDGDNVTNKESGYEGQADDKTEIIMDWGDAQKSLEEEKLRWLNNEFLESHADDIDFVMSDGNTFTAKYSMASSKVVVRVFIVADEDDEYFEFGTQYTSTLYNIHQIEVQDIWQCFSYNGYDGTEYTSAVLADKNIVCEIKFENCDEQFICDTLAVY